MECRCPGDYLTGQFAALRYCWLRMDRPTPSLPKYDILILNNYQDFVVDIWGGCPEGAGGADSCKESNRRGGEYFGYAGHIDQMQHTLGKGLQPCRAGTLDTQPEASSLYENSFFRHHDPGRIVIRL